jgi:hypothetical protein
LTSLNLFQTVFFATSGAAFIQRGLSKHTTSSSQNLTADKRQTKLMSQHRKHVKHPVYHSSIFRGKRICRPVRVNLRLVCLSSAFWSGALSNLVQNTKESTIQNAVEMIATNIFGNPFQQFVIEFNEKKK